MSSVHTSKYGYTKTDWRAGKKRKSNSRLCLEQGAIAFNIRTPLVEDWVIPLKNMGLPLKNFVKIKASPPKNSIYFYSTPKEILNFYNLPLENSMVPQPGGGGGGGGLIK